MAQIGRCQVEYIFQVGKMFGFSSQGKLLMLAKERPIAFFTTMLLACVLATLVYILCDWGIFRAVWTVSRGSGSHPDFSLCNLTGAGACWAAVGERFRFILFGYFPYSEQWRAACAIAVFILMFCATWFVSSNISALAWLWGLGGGIILVLMTGGVLGLTFVPTEQWGGLPIVLILTALGVLLGFPIAVILLLLRINSHWPVLSLLSRLYVELCRTVPLITVLFIVSILLPLFLPLSWNISKFTRAFAAIALFNAAYVSEILRGGLLGVAVGQSSAACALGLTKWQTMRFILLPQALRIGLPAIANNIITVFKGTSLITIIGMIDLTTSAKIVLANPIFESFFVEIYVFTALIYFFFCFGISRYFRLLEKKKS